MQRRDEWRSGRVGTFGHRVVGVSAGLALSALMAVAVGARQEDVLPRPPQSLTASVINGTVNLHWMANPAGLAAESFQLQAGSAPSASNVAVVNLPAGQTTLSATAPPGVYYVRVVAVNRFGASGPSNEVVVTVAGDCQLPGVPTGLTATTGPGSVTLRWQSGAGTAPTGHGLLVGSTPGVTNIGTFTIGPATTLVSAAPNGQYFVRVFASNNCGSSAPSAEISFSIGTPTILVPAGIYDGQVFNQVPRFPSLPRITSFVLQLNQPVPTAATQMISAVWMDNAGCRQTQFIFGGTTALGPSISIEQLACNDGDFSLGIRSQSGNTYAGVCPLGGASCTFRMTRR